MTTPKPSELVRRLRIPHPTLEPIFNEAATRIESLERELAEARKVLTDIRDSTYRNAATLRAIAARAIADAGGKGEG